MKRCAPVVCCVALLAAWLARATAIAGAPDAGQPPLNGQQNRGEVRALAKGKVLVAARSLRDPNFVETVVLLVEFSADGAVGLVLNRRTDVPISRVFTGPEGLRAGRSTLFLGGPVETKGILGLARGANAWQNRHVVKDVYLVNSRESLDALLEAGTSPDRCRVYAGYSGWGAEQLQREVIAGAWSVLEGTGQIAFDPEPETLWERLIRLAFGLQARHADDGRPKAAS
jgi:putative transcriptional regulator